MKTAETTEGNKETMSFSVQHIFYALMAAMGFVAIAYFGRSVIIPMALGLLLAFILYPVCGFLESKIKTRSGAIIVTFFLVITLVLGIVVLFSAQVVEISKQFGDFRARMQEMLASLTTFINENILVNSDVSEQQIVKASKEWAAKKSGKWVGDTLTSTTAIFFDLVLMLIYTFLLLLYRTGLKKALVNFASSDKQELYTDMLEKMQKVGQNYLSGMFIVILILGVLNSLGLFLLGIEYAFFFGFMAAILAIIPYIGTIVGGAIPTLFALMTYDSVWYPLGVIAIFWAVQTLEGNFLSPKIVGGKLSLNPLASILALIVGNLIWGIPGMILSLPYLAILKVACDHYTQLQPVGFLLGDNLYEKDKPQESFKEKMKKLFK